MIRSFVDAGTDDVFDGPATRAARRACPAALLAVLRLERLLGVEAQFWLNLQVRWALYHAQRAESAAGIRQIRRLPGLAKRKPAA